MTTNEGALRTTKRQEPEEIAAELHQAAADAGLRPHAFTVLDGVQIWEAFRASAAKALRAYGRQERLDELQEYHKTTLHDLEGNGITCDERCIKGLTVCKRIGELEGEDE